MSVLAEYKDARRGEDAARLRRVIALRAMVASGMSQRQIAQELGISQPAVSQQLTSARDLDGVHPEVLLEAAAPVLKALAAERGFTRLAAFGSIARGDARSDSDFDFLVRAPKGTSSFDLVRFQQLLEKVLGRGVDVVEYAGLKKGLDDDVRRDAVLL
jgi:predicted nucleotidyltransferase